MFDAKIIMMASIYRNEINFFVTLGDLNFYHTSFSFPNEKMKGVRTGKEGKIE